MNANVNQTEVRAPEVAMTLRRAKGCLISGWLNIGAIALLLTVPLQETRGGPSASGAGSSPLVERTIKARLSWGHESPQTTDFYLKLLAREAAISGIVPHGLEPGDAFKDGVCQSRAGGGDVDELEFTLRAPDQAVTPIKKPHSIWSHLLTNSDPDTARRLRLDPGYRPDPRKLTFQMNPEGTIGFSVTVDQLLTNQVFWVPSLDVFLSVGDPPLSFTEHQKELRIWSGRGILDQVRREPEASYEQFTNRWEDMGSPSYQNPAAPPPGHIICTTWDSALYKFGIDRGAGVRNDLGSPDHFRFWFDFGELSGLSTQSWRGQKLAQGWPVITTVFEKDQVRYEVEQFAYPLDGPPDKRRGDIPMVLLQQVRLSSLAPDARTVSVRLTHQRRLPPSPSTSVGVTTNGAALLLEDSAAHRALLAIEGPGVILQSESAQGAGTNLVTLALRLPPTGAQTFIVKLPSPVVSAADRARLLALDHGACREATTAFWSNYVARGARFVVPEEPVNELFRANLWHALRLPRRHGGQGTTLNMDLPYSNFAYDQRGTPWPVNQAIYVDYMLYDLRGYPDLSAEELAVIFRNNQEPSGHIGGFANWGVYTPSMIYAVARHYLLSGDRAALDKLLPQTLKALDWCLSQMKSAAGQAGPARGLVLAPLNDLSHDAKAWAFNQAYLFAGVDLLGRVLAEIQHPRAPECRVAAQTMYESVRRGFGQGSVQSPLVQLRDHSWSPYVPGDALTPGRLFEVWYPTDVDTGPLHLPRLKALDPNGPATTALLQDHEDNLFFKGWGMANEPVYNQHATVYLLRDEPPAAIRAFYSMMACAFSHSVFEPVEHRWAWGQYFGPPSTDGAWFELYRHMLIHERDPDTLLLLQATPRQWLEDGKQIRVERAPTYYGSLSLILESRASSGEIRTTIEMPSRKRPGVLLVRLRHPRGQAMRRVFVNGHDWTDFDVRKEWIQIPGPGEKRYVIVARY